MDCDGSLGPKSMSMLPSLRIAGCSCAGPSVRIQHAAICLLVVPGAVALQGLREYRTMWAGFKISLHRPHSH